MAHGRRPLALLGASLATLLLPECTGKTTQAAGLEVIVATSGLRAGTDFDTVEIVVQQETSPGGTWHQLFDTPRRVPSEITLPTTFSIQVGSSPDQEALIEVTALKGGSAVVQRVAQVQVPANRVAELLMVLAADCVGQVTTCPNGSCQPATGACGPNLISTTLPTYTAGDENRVDAGATAVPEGGTGAGDAAPPMEAAVNGPEAGPPEAGPPEASVEGGSTPDTGAGVTESDDASGGDAAETEAGPQDATTGGGMDVSCDQGYVPVNGTCVCDMNGTFAAQFSFTTSWSGINGIEDATNVSSQGWALRTQVYDSTGTLTLQTTPCGTTTIDQCGTSALVGIEAYAQYLPAPIFGTSSMPVDDLVVSLPNPLPGQVYQEPSSAFLYGIALTDPLGTWPAASANIGAGSSQTNGAMWADTDGDGFAGVTSYVVPPGGISHTTAPDPIEDFAATSSACPRQTSGTRDAYNYLAGLSGSNVVRIKRLYEAQRFVSSATGTITSCDATGVTLIEGTLGGPDSGEPHVDQRVSGCVQVNGTGETACTASTANIFDEQTQNAHVTSASFILKRVSSTATCATVRAMTFP